MSASPSCSPWRSASNAKRAPAEAVPPPPAPPVVEGEERRAFEERPKAPEGADGACSEEEGEAHRRKPLPSPRGRGARAAPRIVRRLWRRCLGLGRRARRREASRRQGAPAPPSRAPLHVSLPCVRRAHHAPLSACSLRALQSPVSGSRGSSIRSSGADAARPHPPRSRERDIPLAMSTS